MSALSNIAVIAQRWAGAAPGVVKAIQSASATTGVSFDYLMNKAKQESSFNTTAKASTSSATGLFQFIDSTWLSAVKTYGDKFGLGDAAAKISVDSNGKATVADEATKQQILDLRNDPKVSSDMVAAMTKDNASYLQASLGGKVGNTDLYLAHFLGLGGADKFLKAKQDNPLQAAADLFPAAAKANRGVFYNADGSARSLDSVYNTFAAKMGDDKTSATGTALAANAVTGTVSAGIAAHTTTAMALAQHARSPISAMLGTLTAGKQVAADPLAMSDRKSLETIMSGLQDYGAKSTQNNMTGNLLSPYTAFVLAKLKMPDEKTDDKDTLDSTLVA